MSLFEYCKEQFHNLSKFYQYDLNRLRGMITSLKNRQTSMFPEYIAFLKDSLASRRQLLGDLLPKLKESPYFSPVSNVAQSLSIGLKKEEQLVEGIQAYFGAEKKPEVSVKDEEKFMSSVFSLALKLYEDNLNLSINAHHYLDELAYYADLFDMSKFARFGHRIDGINALEIFKIDTKIKGGVVIIPGILGTIKSLELLALRLASRDYLVIMLDEPGHAASFGEFNVGILVERIYNAVGYLRNRGANRVAVLGHSMGGIAAMFAAANYSHDLEKTIIELFKRLIASADTIEKKPSNLADCLREFDSNYVKIKEAIERSIQRNPIALGSSYRVGRINAIICLAAPENVQRLLPPMGAFKKLGFRGSKLLIDNLFNKPIVKDRSTVPFPYLFAAHTKKPVPYDSYSGQVSMEGIKYAEIQHLRVEASHYKEFIEYIETFQNPEDYMQLLLYFSQNNRSRLIHDFVETYVKKIPKLFAYGTEDTLLKPQKKGNRERIESVYRLMGNARIKSFARLQHQLIQGVPDMKASRMQAITAAPVVEEIINFLDAVLA